MDVCVDILLKNGLFDDMLCWFFLIMKIVEVCCFEWELMVVFVVFVLFGLCDFDRIVMYFFILLLRVLFIGLVYVGFEEYSCFVKFVLLIGWLKSLNFLCFVYFLCFECIEFFMEWYWLFVEVM